MAYSTIANESTQWNGISILSRKGAIQFLRRKPFLGSYECRTLSSYNYCREKLFRQLLLEIKRRPHYIIIGRLLRQRAKLSHDRLDYLYFSDAGIIQLGRNRRNRKIIRNVLSVWQTINGGLQPRRHFHDKYFRRISIKSLDQLLK
jgi:hypothetical protein